MKLATRTFRKNRGNGSNEYYVTSPFGWRKDPISGQYKGHNGCDYGTHGKKWAQYALEDGIVESVYKDSYGAICVRIAYSRLGIRLTYAHLDRACVSKGVKVNANTIFGYTGTTGYSTGIHLHMGVQKIGDSKWIDPESIDYQEKPQPPIPTPTPPEKYPFNAVIKAGMPLYGPEGNKYKYGTQKKHNVVVLGEKNGRYEIKCSSFRPNIVYCDKSAIIKNQPTPSPYPFFANIRKGAPLYNQNGKMYKYGTKNVYRVKVKGEYKGRYQIYCEKFTPSIVYCNKGDIKR